MSSRTTTYTSSFGGYATLNLRIVENTNDAENTSSLDWSAWVDGNGYEFNRNNDFILSIDNNTIYHGDPGSVVDGVVFASGSVTVDHEADGTGSCFIFAEYVQPYGSSGTYDAVIGETYTLSATSGGGGISPVELNQTVVYTQPFGGGAILNLRIDETANSGTNTSLLAWKMWIDLTGYEFNYNNYVVLDIGGSRLYSQNPGSVVDGVVFASGTTSVKHDADGTGSVTVFAEYTQPYGTYGYYDVTINETLQLLSIMQKDQAPTVGPEGLSAIPYAIFANDICIHNTASTEIASKAVNPKLELSANTAGSLTMTLPITNAGYLVDRKSTVIRVYQYGRELWEGRILSESFDFWNNREITCEGELSYLHDSVLMPHAFSAVTPKEFLQYVINAHNSRVGMAKQFTMGRTYPSTSSLTVSADMDYNNAFDAISSILLDGIGGYIRVRKENGKRYLDYYESIADLPESSQTVKLGQNLLDLTRSYSIENYATRIIPLGKSLDTETVPGIKDRVTIESVTGSKYIEIPDAVRMYGVIEAVVEFSDIDDPNELYDKGLEHLLDLQDDMVSIDASAVDLSYADPSIEPIKILDIVGLESPAHSEEPLYFAVTKRTYTFDDPSSDKLTLGIEIKKSLSEYMSYYFKNN